MEPATDPDVLLLEDSPSHEVRNATAPAWPLSAPSLSPCQRLFDDLASTVVCDIPSTQERPQTDAKSSSIKTLNGHELDLNGEERAGKPIDDDAGELASPGDAMRTNSFKELARKALCDQCGLQTTDFEPEFDIAYKKHASVTSGSVNYHMPPPGSYKLALKASGKYDDDEWLGRKSDWAVVFHGTPATAQSIAGIVRSGFKIRGGSLQALHGEKYGEGIYCSPWHHKAMMYAHTPLTVGGESFSVLFQCRVKSGSYEEVAKEEWIVKDSDAIRPCGILLIRFFLDDDEQIRYDTKNPYSPHTPKWNDYERIKKAKTVAEAKSLGRSLRMLQKDMVRERLVLPKHQGALHRIFKHKAEQKIGLSISKSLRSLAHKKKDKKREERDMRQCARNERMMAISRRHFGDLTWEIVFGFPGWRCRWDFLPESGLILKTLVDPAGREFKLLRDVASMLGTAISQAGGSVPSEIAAMVEAGKKNSNAHALFRTGSLRAKELEASVEIYAGSSEVKIDTTERPKRQPQDVSLSGGFRRGDAVTIVGGKRYTGCAATCKEWLVASGKWRVKLKTGKPGKQYEVRPKRLAKSAGLGANAGSASTGQNRCVTPTAGTVDAAAKRPKTEASSSTHAMASTVGAVEMEASASSSRAAVDASTGGAIPVNMNAGTDKGNSRSARRDLSSSKIEAGSKVRLRGLQLAPNLNGLCGNVELFVESTGRWRVRLDSGESKDLKADNLELHRQGNTSSQGLRPGLRVQLHALKLDTELNGQEGILERFDESRMRWQVKLGSARIKYLKPENLEARGLDTVDMDPGATVHELVPGCLPLRLPLHLSHLSPFPVQQVIDDNGASACFSGQSSRATVHWSVPAAAPSSGYIHSLAFSARQHERLETLYALYLQREDAATAAGLIRILLEHVSPGELSSLDFRLQRYRGDELALLKTIARNHKVQLSAVFPEFFFDSG
eukprot:TRINITY_DN13957_c0_g2_i2.p1 TRINITY_DN13957_c0_g2~~TRINITY_DN13957_c0_g2_i2.p1  ORF type:complete len:1106 (+),score=180.66 TRINITY_DN13957_c0_g2_i2:455-3319(+)